MRERPKELTVEELSAASEVNKGQNLAIVGISARADIERVVKEYLERRKQFTDEKGELLPRYQLPPMVASFMQEEDEHKKTERKAISVPKGPIEVW